MNQLFRKIFVSLAIVLVCGHNVFPHHHHDEELIIDQHHGQDDDHHDGDHDLFSTAHVDDAFVTGKMQCGFYFDAAPVVLETAYRIFNAELTFVYKKPEYSLNKEFPPPSDYHYTSSLRGPPHGLIL